MCKCESCCGIRHRSQFAGEDGAICLTISAKNLGDSMGGPGSGRWYRWQGIKTTVEEYRRIDVRDWQRRGLLRPGTWFPWGWYTRDGAQVASINVQVQQGRVLLSYRIRRQGEDWQDIEEPVSLAWTPCHYGGRRLWFICPGVVNGRVCGRRVAILYSAGRYFLCRQCYNLAYESQREDDATRLVSKAQKIRRRLGGSASLIEPFPPKPRYMHRRTYERLWWKAHKAEEAGMNVMLVQFERRSARINPGVSQYRDR
jgi:hypothetical protein